MRLMLRGAVPALVLALAGIVAAQEPPKAAGKVARVAVLDIDRVWSESLLGKSYLAQIEKHQNEILSLRNKKQAEITKLSGEIKAQEEELRKQAESGVLAADVVEKRTKELNKRKRDAQDFVQESEEEISRMKEGLDRDAERLKQEFLQKLRPTIDAVTRERGIDILLPAQPAFLPSNKEFDLSQDVIVRADDAEKAARAAGKPATPAKPAAVPAKPPEAKASPTPAPSPNP